jgi:hypothetical protein
MTETNSPLAGSSGSQMGRSPKGVGDFGLDAVAALAC